MRAPCRLRVLAILAIALSGPAYAGDPPSAPTDYAETPNPLRLFIDQWSPYPPLPGGLTLDFLRSADEESAALTLREAVLVGVENNPGITVERLEPFRTAEETLGEKSIFDPTLVLEYGKNYAIDPKGTRSASFSTALERTRNHNYNLSVRKILRTGAQLDISFLNRRLISSFPTQVLKPQDRPHLGFSVAQPLLRDFGWGLTTIFVRMAENREEISLFDYRVRLAQLIQRITEAYWGIVFGRENLKVQRKGVELAEALLQGAEARVRAGILAPVAAIEARAEKARREELVIKADNELKIARTELRFALNLNPQKTFLPRRIEPAESPSVLPLPVERVSILENALIRRPEILSASLKVQNQALQARYAENQLLPRLDLKAGAGLTGLGGDLKPGESNPYAGNYASAIDRLGSGNFYDYSVGVILQIPLSNAQARSRYATARIELDQARARQRELISQITVEVERALGDVDANFKRIRATQLAREMAGENLRGQEKRFQAGLVTLKDVIDFQSRALEAEGAELRAMVDYNNSISRLKLAEGTLLEQYNIRVEGPRKESDPWWARF